jgi:hypothetical protein
MLGDTRHTFDLATLALLSETSASDVDTDIRETLRRISELESELWTELIVHVSVQGGADIGSVLGLTLLIKMIERIGDQTRNVLDLAEAGASLSGQPDTEAMLSERQVISGLFGEVAALLQDPDDDAFEDLEERGSVLIRQHQARIEEFLHSDRPGYEAVPRAIYYRYLKRIVANLLGVVRAANEPVPEIHDGVAPAN